MSQPSSRANTKKTRTRKPVIGLALGGGAARGWAHIGVIRRLEEMGVVADIVTGTSIGALVGASYAAGQLDKLEQWVCSLSRLETARYFEINAGLNGFVNHQRLHNFMQEFVTPDGTLIEQLSRTYGAVSVELETGREVWFTRGDLEEAVWASISLPGLFPALPYKESWLVDGGLVNPVPVSLCRALGAEVVIAVNLNNRMPSRRDRKPIKNESDNNTLISKLTDKMRSYSDSLFNNSQEENGPPGLMDAIAGSIYIMQDRITRSRMAGDPPEIILTPAVSHIGLLEFYLAKESITEGGECVTRAEHSIQQYLA